MRQHLRRTKIVATIGPVSGNSDMIGRLMDAGANYFRLNFSHGSLEAHKSNIQLIRKIAEEKKLIVGILADLQGPKIRVGEIEGGGIDLSAGDKLIVTTHPVVGNRDRVCVSYEKLPQDVKSGDKFLLDDGLLCFKVASVDESKGELECEVIFGGKLKSNKGINLPGVDISAPALTDEDIINARFAVEQDVDYFALSFVRRAEDIDPLKKLIADSGRNIPVIAKIERHEALENIDEIIRRADGLMVARGDLGVELPSEKVPLIQKSLIRKSNIAGKPVITATQMLESMIQNPRPTRAEVSDVANAILDGTDAIMLSGETAVGKYPVEAVKKMVDIATEIEQTAPILYTRRHGVKEFPGDNVEETLALGVCDTVKALKCHGIFSWTQNGHVISLLSKFHPICPTIAYMSSNHIARRVQLLWGSIPVVIDENPAGDGDWDARIQSYLEANHLGYSGYVIVTETENPVSTDRMNSFRVVNLSRCHC